MEQVGRGGYPWSRTLLEGALFFQSNRRYLVNLLSHTSGRNAFQQTMVNINYESLKRCVAASMPGSAADAFTDQYIRIYCMGTVGLCCEWLTGRLVQEPENIAQVWERSLPGPLQPYLYNGDVTS